VTTATAPARVLTIQDRCDRCGSQAFIAATLPSGSVLLFCGHHGRRYLDALRAQGADIRDETEHAPR
jgi:hypothetical protein